MPRRGSALHITLALSAALAALYWAGAPSAPSTRTAAHKAAARMGPATRAEVEVALARAGLTLKTVAAAGLSAPQVAAAVGDAAEAIAEDIEEFRAANIAAGSARADVDRLARLIRGGASTEQDRAAHTAALAALAAAQADAQAVVSAAFSAASANLTGGQITVLQTIQANTAWDLPTQYLAADREQADWVNLRDALTNLRQATQWGQDPDPAAQTIVTNVNNTPAVSTAATNLSGIGELQDAWITAVTP